MSKPRYKWWSYVRWMIRLYPERLAELRQLQDARITTRYDGQPGRCSGVNRSTEKLGTVSLGAVVDREFDAVRRALEETAALPDGDLRLQLIDLYYWKRTHDLDGASRAVHISESTGRLWHGRFVQDVARNFGLL